MSQSHQLVAPGRTGTLLVRLLSLYADFQLTILTSSSVPLSLPEPSATVIVLSQLNTRSFQGLKPSTNWSLDFALVKLGEDKPIAHSSHAWFYANSVNLEISLEKGNYVVYVCVLVVSLVVLLNCW